MAYPSGSAGFKWSISNSIEKDFGNFSLKRNTACHFSLTIPSQTLLTVLTHTYTHAHTHTHTRTHTHTHTHTHTQQRNQHQQHANNSVTIKKSSTLWSITAKNTDWSTGPLARPFARSLTLLTRSLARSLCSLPRSWDSKWLDGYFVCVFFYFRP